MPDSFNHAGLFLINTVFNLYLTILTIRLILAYSHAHYSNPVTQLILKLTQPLIAPTRRFIPTYRSIEYATVLWIIIFQIIKIFLLSLFVDSMPYSIAAILLFILTDSIKLILNVLFYAILLRAILSWFQPGFSPAGQLLEQITSPIMRPLQRIIPPINGIDVTPIPALIILQLFIILLP